ncbi:MAG: hypothetical protein M3Q14_01840 [bacterium]|nr:hypothetical protein [bacterium]
MTTLRSQQYSFEQFEPNSFYPAEILKELLTADDKIAVWAIRKYRNGQLDPTNAAHLFSRAEAQAAEYAEQLETTPIDKSGGELY